MNRPFLSTRNSKILGIFLSFFVVLNVHAKNKTNPIVEEILQKAEAAFDRAETKEDKFNIISKKFTIEYLEGCYKPEQQPENFEDFRKLENKYDSNWCNVNALTFAIASGNYNLTKKFLNVVDDVNDAQLLAWGFKQEYTLAHVALDPATYNCNNWNNKDRFNIIKLLAEKGINFEYVVPVHIPNYCCPPITGGDKSGHPIKQREKLQIFALLNGADPTVYARLGDGFKLETLKNPEKKAFKYMLRFGTKYGFEKLHAATRTAFNEGLNIFTKTMLNIE